MKPKMKLLFLMVFSLFMMNVDCVEQKCGEFKSDDLFENTHGGDKKTYYKCTVKNANLTDDRETVTTNTQLNKRSNDDVTMVSYNYKNIVKFIPNSLFTTFINLEYLYISSNDKLEIIKPEFFKNANNLKNFKVYQNDIKSLGPRLFVEAAKLEHINFCFGKIESIHKSAFDGLANLQGIYLLGNKISSLHPSTFSFITKLNILELTGNTCISQKFVQANKKVSEVEAAIDVSCVYDLFNETQKITSKLNIVDEKLKEQTKLVTELESKLNRKNEETLKILQEQAKYQDAKLNQLNSNLSSIIETQMINERNSSNQIADLTKKFKKSEEFINVLIAKQEMDAKTIEELNEKLKKVEVQASLDYDKLEAKIIKLMEEKFDNQKNEIQDLGATKVEQLGKRIHSSLVIVIQDLQGTENSLDARVRKLEKKVAGIWTD